jgi:hypothetical protein
MLRKGKLWLVLLILAVLGGGGYGVYRLWFAPEAGGEAELALQTATVTRGDLSVTAAGSGQDEDRLRLHASGARRGLPL